MPTDTPAAAPSPLAVEIAQSIDAEFSVVNLSDWRENVSIQAIAVIVGANLAPVREAMEHMKAGNHNHAVLCPVCKSVIASLSPSPRRHRDERDG